MIVSVLPWLQSCAEYVYNTRWPRIWFYLYDPYWKTYYSQLYHVIRYEKLQNGVKFVFRCIPGYCLDLDSGRYYIKYIGYSGKGVYCPTSPYGYVYSNLRIFGWSGVLWREILVANTVTV